MNKYTGEVKLKGPNHWEWFKENIDALFDCAPDISSAKDSGSEMIERSLGIQGIAVSRVEINSHMYNCGEQQSKKRRTLLSIKQFENKISQWMKYLQISLFINFSLFQVIKISISHIDHINLVQMNLVKKSETNGTVFMCFTCITPFFC